MLFRMLLISVLAICSLSCAKPTNTTSSQQAALLNVALGNKYLHQGQMELSKQKLVHALNLDPKSPEAHTSIAYLYEMVGDTSEAEAHHKLAIRHGGHKAGFYNNYGTFLCRQKRYHEAESAYHSALKDKKYLRTSEIYENAAACAIQQKDVVKAREYFKAAVRHNPKLELKRYG